MLLDESSISTSIFKEILEISSDWVWEVDEQGRYTYVSSRVEEFLGYKESEVLGKTPFDLMSKEEAQRVQEIFLQHVTIKEAFKNLQNTNIHKDGHEVVLLKSATPILDEEGNLKGYRGTDKDITRETKLIGTLKNQNYVLDQAQEIANIGHWNLNLETNILSWSDQVYRIFGLEPKELDANYENFLKYIHPDDRELVNDVYLNSVKNGSSYLVEHQLLQSKVKKSL